MTEIPVSPGMPFQVQSWTIQTGMQAFGFGLFYDFQDSNYVWLYDGELPQLATGWEPMFCQDPRIYNGMTWATLRKTDGSVDDRPAVIWMQRCQQAQQQVETSTPGTQGYRDASGNFDGVVWRLDWMRGLNAIYGHQFGQ
jgi:hypothetical protein